MRCSSTRDRRWARDPRASCETGYPVTLRQGDPDDAPVGDDEHVAVGAPPGPTGGRIGRPGRCRSWTDSPPGGRASASTTRPSSTPDHSGRRRRKRRALRIAEVPLSQSGVEVQASPASGRRWTPSLRRAVRSLDTIVRIGNRRTNRKRCDLLAARRGQNRSFRLTLHESRHVPRRSHRGGRARSCPQSYVVVSLPFTMPGHSGSALGATREADEEVVRNHEVCLASSPIVRADDHATAGYSEPSRLS